jgi:hypothetical protein
VMTLPNGLLLAALADGAGSADFGGRGATLAVRAAIDTFLYSEGVRAEPGSAEALLHSALTRAREALEQEAAARDTPLRELATTLIVLLATPSFVAVAQIGDGATVVQDAAGHLTALTLPPDEGYINETTFLTADDALETAQVVVYQAEIVSLAAFTDGLQRLALKLPEGDPHPPFFAPLFHFLVQSEDRTEAEAALTALLRSPRLTERTDDDLTLLLATLLT